MPRMEKFNDRRAFFRLKFLYASNVVVNSKIKLNTVVYDIAFSFFLSLKRFICISTVYVKEAVAPVIYCN